MVPIFLAMLMATNIAVAAQSPEAPDLALSSDDILVIREDIILTALEYPPGAGIILRAPVIVIAPGVTLRAADGSDQPAVVRHGGPSATGAAGMPGGDIILEAAWIEVHGLLIAGDGGDGGSATHTGYPAVAVGGRGGDGGRVVGYDGPNARAGAAGHGGAAWASSASGRGANGTCASPDGGSAQSRDLHRAEAFAGNGSVGCASQIHGGRGGDAFAAGGDAGLTGGEGAPGGDAWAFAGDGGDGYSDCGQRGGNGGDGGYAWAFGGNASGAFTSGTPRGGHAFAVTGSGGTGGAGFPRGGGGGDAGDGVAEGGDASLSVGVGVAGAPGGDAQLQYGSNAAGGPGCGTPRAVPAPTTVALLGAIGAFAISGLARRTR